MAMGQRITTALRIKSSVAGFDPLLVQNRREGEAPGSLVVRGNEITPIGVGLGRISEPVAAQADDSKRTCPRLRLTRRLPERPKLPRRFGGALPH